MMRNRLLAGLFLLTLVIAMLISSCGKKDPIVASVDGKETITLNELKTGILLGRKTEEWKNFSELEVRAYLDKMIEEEMKRVGMREADLADDPEVKEWYEPRYQNKMLTILYEKEIQNKIIPESDLESWYDHKGKRIHFSDILIKFPVRASQAQKDSVYAVVDSLYHRVKAGEDFGYLAKQYSQHPASAQADGKVGTIEWFSDQDPIRNALWSMKRGAISKPVANDKGYHILRVDEIEGVERKPYELERSRILAQIVRERKEEMNKAAEEYWNNIKEKKKVVYNEDKIATYAAWFANMPTLAGAVKDSLNALDPERLDEALVTYDGGEYSLRFIQAKLDQFPDETEFRLGQEQILKEFFERDMQVQFLVEEAEKKGLDKEKSVARSLRDLLDSGMVQIFMNRVVGEIDVSPAVLDAYYQSVKQTKYKENKSVKIQEILIKDKALAERVARQAQSGADFGKLAETYTERPQHKEVKGVFSWFYKGRWGALGDKAFEMKKGELAGPMYLESDKAYSIFKLIDDRPERFRTMEELGQKLEEDYRFYVRKERIQSWLADQKAKRQIRINDSVIKDNVGK